MDRHTGLGHHEHPVPLRLQFLQAAQRLFSFQQHAEDGVLLVQVRSRTEEDGERSRGRVGILVAGHAERSSFVLELRKFSHDGSRGDLRQCF
eukprot:scaffold524_cov357-Pavlova_lutheri.AAC.24